MAEQKQDKAVQTTGHAWDGDLQEFNNPLPSWWLWTFYATAVFALVYWIWYPAWPVADDFTKGMATITYESEGKEVTTHWNTRAKLIKEMQEGEITQIQNEYLGKIAGASYEQIVNDADMMAFTRSMAKVIFADNCAACHGVGGQPALVGLYPNLSDDAWLWGGDLNSINTSIAMGRNGNMPGFSKTLSDEQQTQVSEYVLSLSGIEGNAENIAAGKEIFEGPAGGCFACHTKEGTGMAALGSANLTDAIWTVADVNGTEDKIGAVKAVINDGIKREMPAWKGRLSDEQIKLLTVYVHSLGGGK